MKQKRETHPHREVAMRTKHARTLVGMLLAVCLGAPNASWADLRVRGTDLWEPQTQFAFDLFLHLLESAPPRNLSVSPASVLFALAMTRNGASGETHTDMTKALALDRMAPDKVNQAFLDLMSSLEAADPKVTLSIAQSLWCREGLEFRSDFLATNRKYFEAEVRSLDFGDPGARDVINGWVKRETRGKIEDIVDALAPDDILFLINAVYFKGTWTKAFDRGQTRDMPFRLSDGSEIQYPRMHQSGRYDHLTGDGFQAVSLPYGSGRVSMYLFLPDRDSSLAEFLKGLNAARWEEWMRRLEERPGDVGIPRFTLEWERDLASVLSDMGMGVAFDAGRADFSRMIRLGSEKAFISEVRHKTYVEVNEEGTEAAAATSVRMKCTSAGPSDEFAFFIDRPFFYAIRDNGTGTILFMGAVFDPRG
jgi:serine protease inhibitor